MNARVHQPVHGPQHAASYYAASVNRQLAYPPLGGELQVDVCIVGGGYSGLNTAIELARKGLTVALLEAAQLALAELAPRHLIVHALHPVAAPAREQRRRLAAQYWAGLYTGNPEAATTAVLLVGCRRQRPGGPGYGCLLWRALRVVLSEYVIRCRLWLTQDGTIVV